MVSHDEQTSTIANEMNKAIGLLITDVTEIVTSLLNSLFLESNSESASRTNYPNKSYRTLSINFEKVKMNTTRYCTLLRKNFFVAIRVHITPSMVLNRWNEAGLSCFRLIWRPVLKANLRIQLKPCCEKELQLTWRIQFYHSERLSLRIRREPNLRVNDKH